MQIDRDDVLHAAFNRIAAGKNSAVGCAGTYGDHPFWIGRGVVRTLERFAHAFRHRAGHHEQVGMSRRRDKAQAKTLQVIERVVERVDFELAAIA